MAKVTDSRNLPVPVGVACPLEDAVWPGGLFACAVNPRGGDESLRGVVVAEWPDGGDSQDAVDGAAT